MGHPNIHPDQVADRELIHYCEEHDDPWVREVARIAAQMLYFIPEEYRRDPDEWFEENARERSEAKYSIEWAEDERDEASERARTAEEKYNALLLDTDRDEMFYQNNALKSRLREEQLKNERLRAEMAKDAEAFIELEQDHKYLKEVHNTWSIISKPVIDDERIPF